MVVSMILNNDVDSLDMAPIIVGVEQGMADVMRSM